MSDIRLKKITVEPLESSLIIQNGNVSILNTTISSSILNGSLVSNGGISINSTYEASSMTAGGSLTVGGGVGIMKSIYIGKNLNMDTSNGLIVVGGVTENRMYLDNVINKHFYISPDGVNRRFDLYDSTLFINITAPSLNSSTGSLCVAGGVSIDTTENVTNSSNGGAFTVAGGVGIGKNLRVGGNTIISESLTTGSLAVQNINATNNISSGTINLSIGLTSASSQLTNANVTTATVATLLNTNQNSTNISAGTLNLSIGLTTASLQATNQTVTTATVATLLNTNTVSTNISSATLNLSTGLTTTSLQVTNANITNATIGSARISGPSGIGTNGGLLITGGDSHGHSLYVASLASQKRIGFNNTGSVGNIFSYDYGNLTPLNLALQGFGGNVGIDTTSPISKLHVATGNTYNNILFEAGATSDGLNLGYSAINFNGYYNVTEQRINANKNRWRISVDQRNTNDAMFIDTFNGTTVRTLMTLQTSGNVGIGTTSPALALDVNNALQAIGGGIGGRPYFAVDDATSAGWSFGMETDNSFRIKGGEAGGNNFRGGATNKLTITTSGNVGIATTSPVFTLDVNGTFEGSNSNGLFLFASSGNVGIGTTAPSRVHGGSNMANVRLALLNGVFGGESGTSRILIGGDNNHYSMIEGGHTGLGYTYLAFGTSTLPGAPTEKMRIDREGNVGIGTTSPGSKLDVSGTARITTSITTGALFSTNITSTNVVSTNVSSATINLSTGLTSASARITNDIYIGGDEYVSGVTNYNSDSNNVINLYDASNFKRFSLDKNLSSHDFSISRYDSLGNELEKSFNISYSNGVITYNNTIVSSSVSAAAIVIKGGVSIQTTRLAQSESDGGALSIAGGVGIGSNMYIGGDVFIKSTTESVDVSTGSLIIKGGVGISKNLNVLGNTLIVGNLTVNGLTTSIDTTNTVIKDNLLVLNSAPSGSNDSGVIISRYQQDNDIASGDVVNATDPLMITIPSQIGLTSSQVKLHSSANASDNYYTNWWIKVTSGFSNNQVRKIISYSGSTKIATISSSWTSQNPSGGDFIYIYNKPIVGLIFNELNDRFEFGSTVEDPGKTNVTFTDYVPIQFSSLSSVSTNGSSSVTSASILIAGGIGISNSTDAGSITNGGTFTTLGGASIGKTLYCKTLNVNGVNMTPNSGDIFTSITFNASNNQSVASDITGLLFSSYWGFDCYLTARIVGTTNLYTHFHIRGVNKGTSWEIIKTYVGDDTGIEFYITTGGQLQYTTPNIGGFISCVFKARALVN